MNLRRKYVDQINPTPVNCNPNRRNGLSYQLGMMSAIFGTYWQVNNFIIHSIYSYTEVGIDIMR
jgi:hypothetical protein